ncbi:hypothetical protein H7F15_11740 [Pontibacter sp. Tf4]|uniref:hypothetical protein n=1 Tax=Pontibacter sp. Tf4 TaxID=2761620 RepID=UPI0016248E89|nr:hypothetical protein [Pontibacter sp. Tf4]MBB6611712.1 hypothetical protein [Pontibacter sp. Tf4]
MSKEKRQEEHKDDRKNWLEWLVFGLSLAMLLGILGYLTYQTVIYKNTDPEVYAKGVPDPSELAPNRYKVTVYNKGGTTAEAVIVEFTLYSQGQEPEVSELTIPFSPKESEREGWVIFRSSPATADSVVARIVSYKKP